MNNTSFFKTTLLGLLTLIFIDVFSQEARPIKQNNISYEVKLESKKVAYKNKVVSKINDFYNYLEIISNPKMDKQLREHTLKLAQKLFTHDVQIVNFLSVKKEKILLSSFLNNQLNSPKEISFSISDINDTSEDFWENTNYKLSIKTTNNTHSYGLKQLFTLSEQDKKFGSTIKKVVSIQLGEIF